MKLFWYFWGDYELLFLPQKGIFFLFIWPLLSETVPFLFDLFKLKKLLKLWLLIMFVQYFFKSISFIANWCILMLHFFIQLLQNCEYSFLLSKISLHLFQIYFIFFNLTELYHHDLFHLWNLLLRLFSFYPFNFQSQPKLFLHSIYCNWLSRNSVVVQFSLRNQMNSTCWALIWSKHVSVYACLMVAVTTIYGDYVLA